MYCPVNGVYRPVQIRLDSGALSKGANFITNAMVEQYHLERFRVDSRWFRQTTGQEFSCCEAVNIKWKGKDNKTYSTECLILPSTSTVNLPLLGQDFMNMYSGVLFSEDPTGEIHYVAQVKPNVSHGTILT